MRYIELTATVAASEAEQAASLIHETTGQGASIEAPFVQPDLESDAVMAPGASRLVRVYLRNEGDVALARAALGGGGIAAETATRFVDEQDWAEAWKEHFHVERFGRSIVVVPSWREYTPAPGDVVLALDPGMAFGTGQHETTRMCLEALEDAIAPGARVLDVGCGSGILSLAAAGLGAAEVVALDVDPVCVRVTVENARRNGQDGRITVCEGTLGDHTPAIASGAFDAVVANIIARVLVPMAPHLARALSPGGALIVSGVIAEREGEMCDALSAAGLATRSVRAMGDWRCIVAGKP